jgi:putative zinc finger/helix-turn-helix YgiT family protein
MTGGSFAMAERAFSKKCGKCGQRAVALATVPYSIQIDHDGRKYFIEIPALTVPRCSNCGALSIDEVADREVDNAFRQEAGLLTPEQIWNGRDKLGLTQRELAHLLGVAPETVCRWENGGQIQQRSMDRFLRICFAYPQIRAVLADEHRLLQCGVVAVPQPGQTVGTPAKQDRPIEEASSPEFVGEFRLGEVTQAMR